jgi:hypothetical protein
MPCARFVMLDVKLYCRLVAYRTRILDLVVRGRKNVEEVSERSGYTILLRKEGPAHSTPRRAIWIHTISSTT